MMNRRKRHILLLILLVMTLVVLAFIFHNSLQDGAASNSRSGRVVEIIKPLFDPHDAIPEETFHKFTRKMAHFLEFLMLGISASLLAMHISSAYVRCTIFAPLFFVLLSAMTDEFIQSFTGRTSAISDVLIDFRGGAFGILLAYGAMFCISAMRRRKG